MCYVTSNDLECTIHERFLRTCPICELCLRRLFNKKSFDFNGDSFLKIVNIQNEFVHNRFGNFLFYPFIFYSLIVFVNQINFRSMSLWCLQILCDDRIIMRLYIYIITKWIENCNLISRYYIFVRFTKWWLILNIKLKFLFFNSWTKMNRLFQSGFRTGKNIGQFRFNKNGFCRCTVFLKTCSWTENWNRT